MYKQINIKEKLSEMDKRISKYWKDNNIMEESITTKKGKPKFIFYEGPPTANGKPGIHHVMARTIKDSVCRYKTMEGYLVKRKAGWDTHGLPVEIEVEKTLGLHDKKEVEQYGLEKFNKKCKDSVFTYEKLWREMTQKMGYWIDLDNPYITLKNEYIETVWWLLKQLWEKDLIYKGHKIVPYCPSCGTPLSSHEVAQGYKETTDPSVFVKFKTKEDKNTFYLAWTTTPWTLISNTALAVNPNETYVKIKTEDIYLILAKARLSVIKEDYEIVEEFKGESLEFKEYEPLFTYVNTDKKAFFIGLADYVTMSDGTGVVHTAPAFGQDDSELGKKYNLPVINPVDDAGKFKDIITDFKGQFVKDADKAIIRNLKERGLLYKREQIKHTYPFCWRCNSPLLYYARSSWYIKTTEYKNEMIENNKKINWYPDYVGEKRFGEWLENNVDWAISRDRFWGTPLNIWICEKCGKLESIGSIKELKEKGKMKDGSDVPSNIDLHRPYIDDVELTCSCGGKMHRTHEVIDCWFDSGAMPYAQMHYPFEHEKDFYKEFFPADFIAEGIDQTRGWFYSLLAISTMISQKASYKNVLVNDLILDKYGKKMSKSKGNTVDPMKLMENYGADAIRWYLLAVSPPWIPTKFDEKGVKEIVNKFIGTLRNTYSFYVTYANIDNFDAKKYENNPNKTNEIDKWIISRLHTVIKSVTEYMNAYDLTRSVRLIQSFVIDDLSNWYVRRSRRRYWSLTLTDDKKEAYLTLYYVLTNITKLMAPFAPFISEDIYTNLTGEKSVHLADFPQYDDNLIYPDLEDEMKTVITIVSLGRAARNDCQIKVRQTLGDFYVPEKYRKTVQKMENLIKEEINVKNIKYISGEDNFVEYEIKINYKTLGPKYGKHIKKIAQVLANLDANYVVKTLHQDKELLLDVDASTFRITEEDIIVSVKEKEGFVFETENEYFVALDTTLTNELILEGYAREIVNKIQFTRKENNYDIMDNIKIFYFTQSPEIDTVFEKYKDYIMTETLAKGIYKTKEKEKDMQEWNINGKIVYLTLEKI